MDLRIDIEGLSQVQSLFERLPAETDRRLRSAVTEAQALLQREVAEATPTGAHQLLRKSIVAAPVQETAQGFLGEVGTPLDYAVAVELGTKPHMPPVEPLVDWVRAKLGLKGEAARSAAEAIRWKIRHRGTEGVRMFGKTFEKQAGAVQEIFRRALADLVSGAGR